MNHRIGYFLAVCLLSGVVGWQVDATAGEVEDKKLWDSAIEGSLEGVVSALKAGASSNVRSRNGMTPLMWAAQEGHLSLVKQLVDSGADVNAVHSKWGCSVLGFASEQLHPDIVKYLIDKGAKVDTPSKSKWNPLLKAVRNRVKNGDEDEQTRLNKVVGLLLDNGADIHFRNKKKATSLILAARAGNSEIVQMLLDKGAKINDQDKYGNNALMHAAMKGHLDVVTLLLSKGIDVKKIMSVAVPHCSLRQKAVLPRLLRLCWIRDQRSMPKMNTA